MTTGPRWSSWGSALYLLRGAHHLRWGTCIWVGTGGSATVALGSLATGRLAATPAARWLLAFRQVAWVQPAGRTLLVVGLVTMTLAWWQLGRAVRGRADGPRRVLLASSAWAVPLVVTPPAFSGDVWSYVANGLITARHLSPYDVTPSALSGPIVHAVSARWRHSPAPYGPLPLVWGDASAHLSSSLWLGVLSFRLLALVGLALLALAVRDLARLAGHDPTWALWLAVASPFTMVHGIAGAHVDLVMAGLAGGSLQLALRRRWVLASLLVGVAAAVKVPALLAVVPVALAGVHMDGDDGWWPRLRATTEVGVVAGTTLVATGFVTGLGSGWISGLRAPLSAHSTLSATRMVGGAATYVTHTSVAAAEPVAGAAMLGLLCLWVILRTSTSTPSSVLRAGTVLFSSALLLSPVVHFWYLFWCLPFVAATPGRRRAGRVVVALIVAFGLLAPFDASQHLPGARIVELAGTLAALVLATIRFPAGSPEHARRDTTRREP